MTEDTSSDVRRLRNLEAEVEALKSNMRRLQGWGTVDGSLVRGRIDAQTGEIGEMVIGPNGQVRFGDDVARLGPYGVQLETDDESIPGDLPARGVWFVPALTDDPSTTYPKGFIGGSSVADAYHRTRWIHQAAADHSVESTLASTTSAVGIDPPYSSTLMSTVMKVPSDSAALVMQATVTENGSGGIDTRSLGLLRGFFYPGVLSVFNTISGGVLTIDSSCVQVEPQTGTTDDLDTITGDGVSIGAILLLLAESGDTITVKHGTGNILLAKGADFELTDSAPLFLLWNTTNWLEIGGTRSGMTIQTNDGQYLIPAGPSAGTTVASAASANGYGSWVQMTASTAEDIYILAVSISPVVATHTYVQIDIATGAAASESSIGELHVGVATSGGDPLVMTTYLPLAIPLKVVSGTRIACRTADSSASALSHILTLHVVAVADTA